MSPRDVARQLAVGRIVLGVALLLGGRRTLWVMWGPDGDQPLVRLLSRLLGVRDAAAGALLLHTIDRAPVNQNMLRGLAALDAVDLTAAVRGRKSIPFLPQRLGFFLVAGGSAVAHAALSRQIASPQGLESVAAQAPPQPASSPEAVEPDGAEEAKRMMGARTINVPTPGSSN